MRFAQDARAAAPADGSVPAASTAASTPSASEEDDDKEEAGGTAEDQDQTASTEGQAASGAPQTARAGASAAPGSQPAGAHAPHEGGDAAPYPEHDVEFWANKCVEFLGDEARTTTKNSKDLAELPEHSTARFAQRLLTPTKVGGKEMKACCFLCLANSLDDRIDEMDPEASGDVTSFKNSWEGSLVGSTDTVRSSSRRAA